MNDVLRIIREKPSIETPWHRRDIVRPKLVSLFILQPLIEAWKQPKDAVEIVPRKIVEEHLEFRWLPVEALAGGFNGVKDVGRHLQRVGATGAAQVNYS